MSSGKLLVFERGCANVLLLAFLRICFRKIGYVFEIDP